MEKVLPDLTDNVIAKDPLSVCGLACLDHSDMIANPFHFLALFLDQLPLVYVDNVQFSLFKFDISFLLLSASYLLGQLELFVFVVDRAEVVGALIDVLAHEAKLGATHEFLVMEHLLKLLQWFHLLSSYTLICFTRTLR